MGTMEVESGILVDAKSLSDKICQEEGILALPVASPLGTGCALTIFKSIF